MKIGSQRTFSGPGDSEDIGNEKGCHMHKISKDVPGNKRDFRNAQFNSIGERADILFFENHLIYQDLRSFATFLSCLKNIS